MVNYSELASQNYLAQEHLPLLTTKSILREIDEPKTFIELISLDHLHYSYEISSHQLIEALKKIRLENHTLDIFHHLQRDLTDAECKTTLKDKHFNTLLEELSKLYIEESKEALSLPLLVTMYGESYQARYNAYLRAGTLLSSQLKQIYQWTSHAHVAFLALVRGKIEEFLARGLVDYGKVCLQENGWVETTTPLLKNYAYLFEKLKAKNNFTYIVNDHQGNTISLSEFHQETQLILHSSRESSDLAMKYVHYLYSLVEEVDADNHKDIFYLCGKIFWVGCHAKPWIKGDPSILEMLVRSLMESKGIAYRPWNPQIIPWGETILIVECEEFAQNFEKLFIVEN